MSDDSHFKRHHFLRSEKDGEQMSVILDAKLQMIQKKAKISFAANI